MLRLIKLFSYALFAFLLPLWLYLGAKKPKDPESKEIQVGLKKTSMDSLLKSLLQRNDEMGDLLKDIQVYIASLRNGPFISIPSQIDIDLRTSPNQTIVPTSENKATLYVFHSRNSFPTIQLPYASKKLILRNSLDADTLIVLYDLIDLFVGYKPLGVDTISPGEDRVLRFKVIRDTVVYLEGRLKNRKINTRFQIPIILE